MTKQKISICLAGHKGRYYCWDEREYNVYLFCERCYSPYVVPKVKLHKFNFAYCENCATFDAEHGGNLLCTVDGYDVRETPKGYNISKQEGFNDEQDDY